MTATETLAPVPSESAGEHEWTVTEPIRVQIGLPAGFPSAAVLEAMRQAVSTTAATEVYWFQVALSGGDPHLGLAVAPVGPAVMRRVGQAIEPIWRAHRPDNPVFDLFPLNESPLAGTMRASGRLLYRRTPGGGASSACE
jgi:hypothetical protein